MSAYMSDMFKINLNIASLIWYLYYPLSFIIANSIYNQRNRISNIIIMIIFAYLSILIYTTSAIEGIDTSTLMPSSTYQCIKQSGNLFAIIQTTLQNGTFDGNTPQNLYNAASGGLLTDIKMIPCRGRSAISQTEEILARLKV